MKKAFTFLEVMFGLAIVGLISAMVIPIFFNSFGNKVMGTQLKKVCAQITLGTKEVITDERSDDTITLDQDEENTERGFYFTTAGVKTSNATQGAQYFLNKYIQHRKVNCGPGGSNDCVGQKYRTPEKKNLGTIPSGYYCVQTVNSATICMNFDEDDKVMMTIVDVNGSEKPNITGADTFVMYITDDGNLKDLDENADNCNKDRESGTSIVDYAAGCFTKVVANGWAMPKD